MFTAPVLITMLISLVVAGAVLHLTHQSHKENLQRRKASERTQRREQVSSGR